jgi:hypothetical protein
MSRPRLFNRAEIGELKSELSMLLLVSAVLAVHTFGLPWLVALVVAPLIGFGIVLVLALLVEVLWIMVSGVDRVGSAIGVRKSPLQ